MKELLFSLVLVITISNDCFATDPPPVQAGNAGEVIFFTETAYEDPIIVTCTLAGVVFDQDAIWNTDVSGLHPQYDSYIHYGTNNENNKLAGSTNALTNSNGLISWESVYDADEAASSDICTGMIGWGKYVFTVGNENEDPDIVFSLNTLDGRWMYSGDPDALRISSFSKL
jgi:hypothetical protein